MWLVEPACAARLKPLGCDTPTLGVDLLKHRGDLQSIFTLLEVELELLDEPTTAFQAEGVAVDHTDLCSPEPILATGRTLEVADDSCEIVVEDSAEGRWGTDPVFRMQGRDHLTILEHVGLEDVVVTRTVPAFFERLHGLETAGRKYARRVDQPLELCAHEGCGRPGISDLPVAHHVVELEQVQNHETEFGLGHVAGHPGLINDHVGDHEDLGVLGKRACVDIDHPQRDDLGGLGQDRTDLLLCFANRAPLESLIRATSPAGQLDGPGTLGMLEGAQHDELAANGSQERCGSGLQPDVPSDGLVCTDRGHIPFLARREQHGVDRHDPVRGHHDAVQPDDLDLALAPVSQVERSVLELVDHTVDSSPLARHRVLGAASFQRALRQTHPQVDNDLLPF